MRRAFRFLVEMWEPQNTAFQYFPLAMLAFVFVIHAIFIVLILLMGGPEKP